MTLEALPINFSCIYDLSRARSHISNKVPAIHQQKALTALDNWFKKKVAPKGGILTLPTGGGKTFVAVRFLCQGPLSEGYKVLWLAHTHHLLEQAFFSFGGGNENEPQNGYEVGHVFGSRSTISIRVVSGTPGHNAAHQVSSKDDIVIGTLQTITRAYQYRYMTSIKKFVESAKGKLVVIFDEAHHAPAPSYRKFLEDLRHHVPDYYLLGLTATPTYTDVTKKGWLFKLFPQQIIYQETAQNLMASNILAEPVLEEPQTNFTPQFEEVEYQKWAVTYRDLPEEIITQLALNEQRNRYIAETYIKNKARYGKTIIFADRWYQCEQLRHFLNQKGACSDVMYSHIDADPGSVEERNRRDRSENARVLENSGEMSSMS